MTQVSTTQTARSGRHQRLASGAAALLSRQVAAAADAAPILLSSTWKKKKNHERARRTEGRDRERMVSPWRREEGEDATNMAMAIICCSETKLLLAWDQEVAIATIRSLGGELRDLKVGAGCWIGVPFGDWRCREVAIWVAGLLSVWSWTRSSEQLCLADTSECLGLHPRNGWCSSMG